MTIIKESKIIRMSKRRKKGKSKGLVTFLIIAVVLLLIVAVVGKKQGWIGEEDKLKVSVKDVQQQDITERVSATGKIYPEVEVKISPDVSGEIIELNVEEGDSVKKGQLLAKITPDIYNSIVNRAQASVSSSRSGVANAQAQKAQVKANYDNAMAVHGRNQKLYDKGIISLSDLEASRTQLATSQAQLDAAEQGINSAKYNVNSTEAALKEARDELKKTEIYAPMTGVISMLAVKEGERVVGTAQMQGTEMMRIADYDKMETRVEVGENDIIRVSIGDTAEIEVDAYLNQTFKGVVTKISNSADNGMSGQMTSNQVTNFTVMVRLIKSSYASITQKNSIPFRPGMSCSVDIITENSGKTISVPIQSVTTRNVNEDDEEEKDDELKEVVFVYDGGKVKMVEVETGIQDDKYIQITKGLSKNQRVVTAPYKAISRELEDDQDVAEVDEKDLYSKKSKFGKPKS